MEIEFPRGFNGEETSGAVQEPAQVSNEHIIDRNIDLGPHHAPAVAQPTKSAKEIVCIDDDDVHDDVLDNDDDDDFVPESRQPVPRTRTTPTNWQSRVLPANRPPSHPTDNFETVPTIPQKRTSEAVVEEAEPVAENPAQRPSSARKIASPVIPQEYQDDSFDQDTFLDAESWDWMVDMDQQQLEDDVSDVARVPSPEPPLVRLRLIYLEDFDMQRDAGKTLLIKVLM